MSESLADVGEFGLIDRIRSLIENEGAKTQGVIQGIGDDCAAVRPNAGYELLVTCDSLVEGRHYLSKHITPFDLGRRAMALNISDIGSMGGLPLYAMVSMGLKQDIPVAYVEAVYRGFISELSPFGASIIGGNFALSGDTVFLDITLIGQVQKKTMLLRSTAKPGDIILVTGYPGQAAAGIDLLLKTQASKNLHRHPLVRAYNTPCHRAREGHAIALSGYATAMIDISDGLAGDLIRLCHESDVGAILIQENLPISTDLQSVAHQQDRSPHDLVLADSDDYELIITCPSGYVDRIKKIVSELGTTTATAIGKITDASEGIHLLLPDGALCGIVAKGWNHFSRQ